MISVVVPVYNVEKYVLTCLKSLAAQTYTDYEVIVVNDGSTDGSGAVCREFCNDNNKFFYYEKTNGGLSDARNYGIERASGEYIMFVDSDDYVNKLILETLFNRMNEKTDIAICNFTKVYDNSDASTFVDSEIVGDVVCIDDSGDALKKLFDRDYGIIYTVAWGKLFRKELFDNIAFPVGKIHEDEFTAYKLYLKARGVIYVSDCLYYYYQRTSSIMGCGFSKRSFDKVEAYGMRADEFIRLNNVLAIKAVKWYIGGYVDYANKFLLTQAGNKADLQQYYHIAKDKVKSYKSILGVRYWVSIFAVKHAILYKKIKRLMKKR